MNQGDLQIAGFEEGGESRGGRARQAVSGPATALLVTAIPGIALQLLNLILVLAGVGFMAAQQQAAAAGQNAEMMVFFRGTGTIVGAIIGSLIGIVIAIGAVNMKNLQSYGLAMAASILAMIPCVSPRCLLGLPFGIWAVVVLGRPEVKTAFH
jgi:hypothetical protein